MMSTPGMPVTTDSTDTTGESRSGSIRIDAHHHVWDLDVRPQAFLAAFPAIHRTFLLDELQPLLTEAGVDGTVLIQVDAVTAETEEFLALAAREPVIRGVVGWVDLTSGGVPEEIARLRGLPGGDHNLYRAMDDRTAHGIAEAAWSSAAQVESTVLGMNTAVPQDSWIELDGETP